MCGIAGKISFTSTTVSPADIERMTNALQHRGPDDAGLFVSPTQKVGLGHRRLSIIDLSSAGHQPMTYKNRYTITFNGEIYNFATLRQQLIQQGYTFSSHTDTEVILALYDRDGVNCVHALRGMFALAIYDQKNDTLFCARDRLGKKPFKYYQDGKVFIFGSELKAILTQPEYNREPDYVAIHHYLTYQYVPAPATGFMSIKKLPAAHYLTLNCQTGAINLQRYWQPNYSDVWNLSETEWKRQLLLQLQAATALRLTADVPVGAFLSGGLDSSAVVALMSQASSQPVKTFSVGFLEQSYSELEYARLVSHIFKTEHHEFIVKPDMVTDLPALITAYEEPYADSSAWPSYYLSQLTRQYVTVALNGDGGDENFAGYDRYSLQKSMLWISHQPQFLLRIIQASSRLSKRIPNRTFDRLAIVAASIQEPLPERYSHYINFFSHSAKRNLYSAEYSYLGEINSVSLIAQKFAEATSRDPLTQTLYADLMTYLPDDLLVKMDIASMAHSLEARSPLLDHKLIEFTAHIPNHLKIAGLSHRKYIFKEAMRGLLPNTIIDRPKKGFSVPLDRWFRRDLKPYLEQILLSSQAQKRNLFRTQAIKQLIHTHNRIDVSNQLWALLTLELWFQEFFPT